MRAGWIVAFLVVDRRDWNPLALSGDGIRPNAEGELVGEAGAWIQVQHLEPRVSGPVVFDAAGPFTLSIEDDLTVTGPQGVFTLPTGELRSFDSDESLTWSVQHRWTAATRVDHPGWVRVGVLPSPPVESPPSP